METMRRWVLKATCLRIFCHCGVIMFVWRIPSSMGYDKRCISTYPIIIYSMWKYEVCTLFNRKGFAIGGYICMSIYNTYLQEIAVKLLLYLSIQCPVIYGKICFFHLFDGYKIIYYTLDRFGTGIFMRNECHIFCSLKMQFPFLAVCIDTVIIIYAICNVGTLLCL